MNTPLLCDSLRSSQRKTRMLGKTGEPAVPRNTADLHQDAAGLFHSSLHSQLLTRGWTAKSSVGVNLMPPRGTGAPGLVLKTYKDIVYAARILHPELNNVINDIMATDETGWKQIESRKLGEKARNARGGARSETTIPGANVMKSLYGISTSSADISVRNVASTNFTIVFNAQCRFLVAALKEEAIQEARDAPQARDFIDDADLAFSALEMLMKWYPPPSLLGDKKFRIKVRKASKNKMKTLCYLETLLFPTNARYAGADKRVPALHGRVRGESRPNPSWNLHSDYSLLYAVRKFGLPSKDAVYNQFLQSKEIKWQPNAVDFSELLTFQAMSAQAAEILNTANIPLSTEMFTSFAEIFRLSGEPGR